MVNIMQFIENMKSSIGGEIYPLFFPDNASDDCVVVNFSEVLGRKGTVNTVTCTFLVRSTHPQTSLDKCQEIKDTYDRKTNLFFDNTQIILMSANQESGQFRGVDDQGRYVFQIDFKILTTRTDIVV